MSTFQLYEKLKQTLSTEAAEAVAGAFEEFADNLRRTVTREDFSDLREIVVDLGLAQKRTETQLEELAQAQKRTEIQVEELAQAQKRTETQLEELAQAQKRTEIQVEELAQAQKRTEIQVEELAQAQKRTEIQVEELAQAQKRTENTMHEGFKNFDRRLSVIGMRWGDGAEEAFRQGLLESVKALGYSVEHFLGQDTEGYINRTPRSYDLDILILNGTTVAAEIKANASGADVTEFHRSVRLYEQQTGRRVDKAIIVAVTIQRKAYQFAQELGVIVATDFDALNPTTAR